MAENNNFGEFRSEIMTSFEDSPTQDELLRIINDKHALREMRADELYIVPFRISNQELDSYHTRMSESTLRNYVADYTAGRALMNSHRTGGGFFGGDAELPIGHTFLARATGVALPNNAPYEAVGGMGVRVYSYIQRGLTLNGQNTDHVITALEGGTIKDTSVGFSLGSGGSYRCALCGSNLMSRDDSCKHVPGIQYEKGRAYAWVENAHAREASLVYKGATPGAYVEKAQRMVRAGYLSRNEALSLEDQWNVRIITGTPNVINREITQGTLPMWETFIAQIRLIDPALADRIQSTEESLRLEAISAHLRGVKQTLDTSQTELTTATERATNAETRLTAANTEIDSLKIRATMGDQWIDSLVKSALEARVRAEGQNPTLNSESYTKYLRGTNDPVYIQNEIDSWNAVTRSVFGDGKRPTTKADKNTSTTPRNVAAYR